MIKDQTQTVKAARFDCLRLAECISCGMTDGNLGTVCCRAAKTSKLSAMQQKDHFSVFMAEDKAISQLFPHKPDHVFDIKGAASTQKVSIQLLSATCITPHRNSM